jgi:hypothetical protein
MAIMRCYDMQQPSGPKYSPKFKLFLEEGKLQMEYCSLEDTFHSVGIDVPGDRRIRLNYKACEEFQKYLAKETAAIQRREEEKQLKIEADARQRQVREREEQKKLASLQREKAENERKQRETTRNERKVPDVQQEMEEKFAPKLFHIFLYLFGIVVCSYFLLLKLVTTTKG